MSRTTAFRILFATLAIWSVLSACAPTSTPKNSPQGESGPDSNPTLQQPKLIIAVQNVPTDMEIFQEHFKQTFQVYGIYDVPFKFTGYNIPLPQTDPKASIAVINDFDLYLVLYVDDGNMGQIEDGQGVLLRMEGGTYRAWGLQISNGKINILLQDVAK